MPPDIHNGGIKKRKHGSAFVLVNILFTSDVFSFEQLSPDKSDF